MVHGEVVVVDPKQWPGLIISLSTTGLLAAGSLPGIRLGTCESVFCVRIESRIESAVRFDFESNFRIESAVYTTQAVTPSNELQGAPCRRTV